MQLARAATTDSESISLARVLTDAFRHAGAGSNIVFAFLVRIASAIILYISQIVLARWMGGLRIRHLRRRVDLGPAARRLVDPGVVDRHDAAPAGAA